MLIDPLENSMFIDRATGKTCTVKILDGESWLCWKHPDGQWVTWRKLTDDDRERIERAMDEQAKAAIRRTHFADTGRLPKGEQDEQ